VGAAGARIAALSLLTGGLSTPILAVFAPSDVFSAYPPGEAAMVGATLLLSIGGALASGWTRPHPEGAPPYPLDAVIGCVGVAIVVGGYGFSSGLHPCAGCQPRDVLEPAMLVLAMMVGILLATVSAWRIGRRTAERGLGVALLGVLGCCLSAAALFLLVAGVVIAIVAGSGIGLSDNGPSAGIAAVVLVVTLPFAFGSGWAAFRSFRSSWSMATRMRVRPPTPPIEREQDHPVPVGHGG
jgi:hypothetical protein